MTGAHSLILIRMILIGAICGGLLSCTSSIPVKEYLGWEGGPVAPATAPFILLGDTQEHEITGLPAIVFGGISDRGMTEVTIRPPQQSLFGRFLFADLFRPDHGLRSEPAVIHLGDLLDISCRSELARYQAIFDDLSLQQRERLVLVPGNHDGTAHGTLNIVDNNSKFGYGAPGWDYECRVPGMQKDYFANEVVRDRENFLSRDALLAWYANEKRHVLRDTDTDQDPEVIDRTRSGAESAQSTPIDRMIGKIIPRDPSRQTNYAESFLVQKISLPQAAGSATKVSIIALDTTQFPGHLNAIWQLGSTLSDNPGQTGYVLSDQIEAVAKLVRAQGSNEIIVFAGHHDWESLDTRVKWALSPVFAAAKNPIVYLSAHTHEGFWRRWRVGGRAMLEFNVSSLADWPIAYRTLCIAASPDRQHLRVLAGFSAAEPACGKGVAGDGKSPTASMTETISSKPLVAMWRSLCANFDAELEMQRAIVHKHREERQKIAHLFARLLFGSQAASFSLYRDKLNDLTIAGYVLLDTARRYPLLKAALNGDGSVANHGPYRLDNETITGEKCRQEASILSCLENLPGVSGALANDLARVDSYPSVQKRYWDLARVIAAAQDEISKIEDGSLKHDLACIAAAAAADDAAEQNGAEASVDDIALDPTFHVTSGDAIDAIE